MTCTACPLECGADRTRELGVCRAGQEIEIAQAQLHHWEEPPISGTRGSGTVFFSHCNLRCRFCQNYEVSQLGRGNAVAPQRLADIMVELQDKGAHNINLVTPTQYTEQLIPILNSVKTRLRIPVVWNSNAYEKVETLRRLEGLVQVWLPDLKYWSADLARQYSSAPDYADHAGLAIIEMRRQAGRDLYDDDGMIRRGLIVRHLVLPGHTDDSMRVLDWLRANLGASVRVSLMAQYYPAHRAADLPGMNRRLSVSEYARARRHFESLEFDEGYVQGLSSASDCYTPGFGGRGT